VSSRCRNRRSELPLLCRCGRRCTTTVHHAKATPFSRNTDPNCHLKTFNAQMLISGGSDGAHCKVFIGTLTGITLKWFRSLPWSSITFFIVLTRTFLERFAANRSKAPKMADLFDIRQGADEPLRDYLDFATPSPVSEVLTRKS